MFMPWYYHSFNMLGASIFVLLVLAVIFLIFRGVILWFWRVNHIVEELREITGELRKMNAREEAKGER